MSDEAKVCRNCGVRIVLMPVEEVVVGSEYPAAKWMHVSAQARQPIYEHCEPEVATP